MKTNKQTKKKRSQVDEVRKGPEGQPPRNTADIICLFVWLMKVTKVMKLSIYPILIVSRKLVRINDLRTTNECKT